MLMQDEKSVSLLAPNLNEGGNAPVVKPETSTSFPVNSLAPEAPKEAPKPPMFGGAAFNLNPNMSANKPKSEGAGQQSQYSKAIQAMYSAAKERAKQPANMSNAPKTQDITPKIEGAIDAEKPRATEQLKAETTPKNNPLAVPSPTPTMGAYAQSVGVFKAPNGRANVKMDDYDVDLGDINLNDDDAVRSAYANMESNHKAITKFYDDDSDTDDDDLNFFA